MRFYFRLSALLLSLLWIIASGNSASFLYALPQNELGKWWKNSGVVKELQLSETQVNRIEQSFLSHREELMPLIEDLKVREDQLNKLMQAESLNDDKILAQAELVAVARAELEKANSSMMLSIRKALSSKQWTRLSEIQDLRNTSSALILHKDAGTNSSGASDSTIASIPSGEKIYSVGGNVKHPVALYQPMPPYTREAKQAGVEGIALFEVVIRKDGSVDSFKVLRGIGYGLDESAIRTIREEWRFRPGTLNGQPVDVKANIEVSFRLY